MSPDRPDQCEPMAATGAITQRSQADGAPNTAAGQDPHRSFCSQMFPKHKRWIRDDPPFGLVRATFLVAGTGFDLRPLGYELTGPRSASPRESQTHRSRAIARPSRHVTYHTPSRQLCRVSFTNPFTHPDRLGPPHRGSQLIAVARLRLRYSMCGAARTVSSTCRCTGSAGNSTPLSCTGFRTLCDEGRSHCGPERAGGSTGRP
jgi:hypothetical protein